MRIEKISDNKIKCILNKNDLAARNLEVADFSYGSEKTNELFKEMTSKAYKKFGFQTDDVPLMIEAIPISEDRVELILSKNDDPEELDTRFSKFTPTPDDVANAVQESITVEEGKLNKANEILNLLSSFREALAGVANAHSKSATPSRIAGNAVRKPKAEAEPDAKAEQEEITLTFVFDSLDNLISLSKVLQGKYKGESSIYQDGKEYYLMIDNHLHTPEEFNQICNMICEYGSHTRYNRYSIPYFSEHYDVILKDDALNELARI